MTAAFLCTGTHHGFSWLPGNGNKNNITYITRQAREWVRINGGAYFVKERSMVWLDSARRWRYHVLYIPNNRG